MLREIRVSQSLENGLTKRWFAGDELDLFLWFNDSIELASYQLSFDKKGTQKAITWGAQEGFSTLGVDDGSRPGKHPGSPLLLEKADLCVAEALDLFIVRSSGLEPTIREQIIDGVRGFLKERKC